MLCVQCRISTTLRYSGARREGNLPTHIQVIKYKPKIKIKMKKFRGKNTYSPRPKDYETPRGKSETIQDDSYSVQDILQLHAQGIYAGVRENADWGDDNEDFDAPDLEEVNRMDIQDRLRIHEEHLGKVKKAKKAQAEAEENAKKKKDEGGEK